MRFDECWISEDQLTALAFLAASTNNLHGEAIEIGAWQGRSAIPVANAVYPGILHAVDSWTGSDDPEAVAADQALSREFVSSRDNYGIFLGNIAEGTRGNICVHKMDWREFAHQWTGSVRFLHIDATHTAREVSDNIAAFLPFATAGAIFAGDDYSRKYPGVIEGVHQHFPDVRTGPDALWWATIGEQR